MHVYIIAGYIVGTEELGGFWTQPCHPAGPDKLSGQARQEVPNAA